jgi:hypothetical protein
VAHPGSGILELEFFAALEGQNLQDQLSYLNEEESQEHEASFRLLRHYAESVRHQKYYGVDVVKVWWLSVPRGLPDLTRLILNTLTVKGTLGRPVGGITWSGALGGTVAGKGRFW